MKPQWQQAQANMQAQMQHHRIEQMQGAAWAEAQKQRAQYGQPTKSFGDYLFWAIVLGIILLFMMAALRN